MALISALFEILGRPTIGGVFVELMVFIAPLWIAVLVGVLVGWSWRPKWANSQSLFTDSFFSPPQSIGFGSIPSFSSLNLQFPSYLPWFADSGTGKESLPSQPYSFSESHCSSSQLERDGAVVTEEDLEHLVKLVEVKDGGPAWIHMMGRSLPNMTYQAWRRDPENGPPQYCSRTVYEDATPELVRDFFWDDEFRSKWDDMLIHAKTLEEFPATGTMIVHWVRKFPFFCSDREYIIGRRIWESEQSYYCITKGVPFPSVPRRSKPRRVDLYYSSWFIRAVESNRGDGQLSACEVLLFHHEDMGIPWEIAKLGVRQGMWGAVKKIDPGLRAYQRERASGAPLSPSASMAQINTKCSSDPLRRSTQMQSVSCDSLEEVRTLESSSSEKKPSGRNVPKFLVLGGAFVLACSLDRGLLTKAVIFGVARRFARIGRRL